MCTLPSALNIIVVDFLFLLVLVFLLFLGMLMYADEVKAKER